MRVGIITGASSGMGKEFVRLAIEGPEKYDEIWVIARREDRLRQWPKRYPDQAFRILALDLSNKEDVNLLKDELDKTKPEIGLFVHCAGFGIMGRIDEIEREKQTGMVDINCKSVADITSLLLPFMGIGSRMIYLASAAAFLPQPEFAVYAASKAFVLSYVRALRAEVRKSGITVTAVCPGAVKTEFFDRAEEKKKLPAYKKLVMADPGKVVKKAWKDSLAGKEVSVYGVPMKLFRIAVKMVPHSLIMRLMLR